MQVATHIKSIPSNSSSTSSNTTTTRSSHSIDSLYQLLKTRVFYKTNYTSWLLECMINVTLPLHSKFGLLIKEFVYCIFLTSNKVEKIPEEWIRPHLDQVHLMTPKHILLTLYMLQFNDAIISFRTDPKLISLLGASGVDITNQQHMPYTLLDVVHTIPLRAMLNHVETTKGSKVYHSIYPDLANLTANLYPELLDVVSFLLYDGKLNLGRQLRSIRYDQFISQDELKQALSEYNSKPDYVLNVLSRLQTISLENMGPCSETVISTLISPCLEKYIDSRIIDAFISTWEYYHLSIPHQIWICTINNLNTQRKDYTFDDLVQNPFVIFQSDSRIFRSKKLLLLWLHILSCLRTSSKHRIWKRFHTGSIKRPFNNRNVMALINAQDSAMLQLLLDLCQEREEDRNDPESLMMARKLICRFIHGVFVEDRDSLLAKTLHFQTYPPNLIPMMVELVPSLYIVFNFLSELTRQPQIEKQVFGILLGCELCEKYPMESYLALAEKCLLPRLMKIAYPVPTSALAMSTNRKYDTSTTQPQQCVPSEYLLQIIPSFAQLARAFPHFSPQILHALMDIQQGLPGHNSIIGQEGSHKIIVLLQLHKVLKDTCEAVQKEADHMDNVNKSLQV
ncbi:integrator complex subunit 2 [Halteromyces radiatus]|uniref:integrator complex subunit 2 n=1 Tax=Halteromyces radiatus TaxID=101107 RepID=UPI00221F5D4E|nr:integrator complex subunit 2 [Halteromyces radiatus]KAI8096694.1 integrator complex subunit 2 [Halteromyces radiatus]